MTVERAFGVLKKRFPILKKPWTSNVQQVVEVMTICIALNNLCCDADSEWDAQRLKMHIENTRNEGPEDLYFDMKCYVMWIREELQEKPKFHEPKLHNKYLANQNKQYQRI